MVLKKILLLSNFFEKSLIFFVKLKKKNCVIFYFIFFFKRKDLKVILMSATLNASQFSTYFNEVPCIEIPGFTYPVEELYLEDILGMVKFKFSEPNKNFKTGKQNQIDPIFQNHILPYVRNLEKSQKYKKEVTTELKDPKSEKLNIDFIAEVIRYICLHEDEGAILVFLPGLSEIQGLNRSLQNSSFFSSCTYEKGYIIAIISYF